jgi:hypothetical protein
MRWKSRRAPALFTEAGSGPYLSSKEEIEAVCSSAREFAIRDGRHLGSLRMHWHGIAEPDHGCDQANRRKRRVAHLSLMKLQIDDNYHGLSSLADTILSYKISRM